MDGRAVFNLKPTASKPVIVKIKVEVDSNPKGADIYINNEKTGLITPTSILLEPRQFAVKLNKEGFIAIGSTNIDKTSAAKGRCIVDLVESKHNLDRNLWSMEVSSQKTEKNYRLFGTLEKDISIETNPDNAKIYFADSDQYIGNSPIKIRLKAGTYRLQIIKAKYKPILTNINIESKQDDKFTFDLKPF